MLFKYVCGIKCMYAETLGCKYADFGCMLGACMRKRLGAKYADVGCKSMERLGACLTVFALPDNAFACLTVLGLPDCR